MKMDILLDSLHRYYDNKKNMTKLLGIIDNNENKISLRIIDWFVTNYSKKRNIYYTLYKTDCGKITFVSDIYCINNLIHKSYKSQLNLFLKRDLIHL